MFIFSIKLYDGRLSLVILLLALFLLGSFRQGYLSCKDLDLVFELRVLDRQHKDLCNKKEDDDKEYEVCR